MEEVFQWVLEHPDAEADDSPGLGALAVELAAVKSQQTNATELATMPGADMPTVRKTLADLAEKADKLQTRIDSERAASVRGGVLEQVRKYWWHRKDEHSYYEDEEGRALAEWPDYWNGLDLDKRREIVQGMLTVTVNPGRGPERVEFAWR